MHKTIKATKEKEIERSWHLIDLDGQILGRASTKIAELLMGKGKPYFVRSLDCGDHVVVINAGNVKVTGKKEKDKIYTRYSGYPGGLRSETYEQLKARKPEEIIRHSVSGMLPHNKLHDRMLKRLYVFVGSEHSYSSKFTK